MPFFPLVRLCARLLQEVQRLIDPSYSHAREASLGGVAFSPFPFYLFMSEASSVGSASYRSTLLARTRSLFRRCSTFAYLRQQGMFFCFNRRRWLVDHEFFDGRSYSQHGGCCCRARILLCWAWTQSLDILLSFILNSSYSDIRTACFLPACQASVNRSLS